MLLKVSMTVSQCKIIAINAQSHSVDANPGLGDKEGERANEQGEGC